MVEENDQLEQDYDTLIDTLPDSFQYNFTQEDVEYLWGLWADFSVYLVYPRIRKQFPPKRMFPEKDEFSQPVLDYGNELKTSRGEELFKGNRTFGKLMNTVEKMIDTIVDRAVTEFNEDEGGGSATTPEIQVAFNGFESLQRRAFRLCIESEQNVLVTNFDPGEWGERQLRCFNELVNKGYLRIKM